MTEHAALPGVDWWQVVTDMERRGYSHFAIGAAIGCARTTVEGWKNRAAEPRHEDGERLLSLWCAVMPSKREDVPRRMDAALSAASFR